MQLVVGERPLRAVAELTGHNAETVRRYLSGQTPSVEFLAAFAAVFGLRVDWLLTGRGPARVADETKAALSNASPDELLSAVAGAVEAMQDRIERIERYVQTLEARTRGLATLAQAAKARKRETHEHTAVQPSPTERAERVADALARRPSADAR